MKLVVFAWGNPSRGDDGVGPWFADYIRSLALRDCCLVEDFQLQVEHLLDCREGDLLLFLDARCDGSGDFRFEEITPGTGVAHTSHALTPDELLGHYPRVFHRPPPPAFQLSVPGREFELGQAMSSATAQCCRRAARWLQPLLDNPHAGQWRRQLALES